MFPRGYNLASEEILSQSTKVFMKSTYVTLDIKFFYLLSYLVGFG